MKSYGLCGIMPTFTLHIQPQKKFITATRVTRHVQRRFNAHIIFERCSTSYGSAEYKSSGSKILLKFSTKNERIFPERWHRVGTSLERLATPRNSARAVSGVSPPFRLFRRYPSRYSVGNSDRRILCHCVQVGADCSMSSKVSSELSRERQQSIKAANPLRKSHSDHYSSRHDRLLPSCRGVSNSWSCGQGARSVKGHSLSSRSGLALVNFMSRITSESLHLASWAGYLSCKSEKPLTHTPSKFI